MKHHRFIMLIITIVVLVLGLTACSNDAANNNSDSDEHGITVIPTFDSDGNSHLMFLPY